MRSQDLIQKIELLREELISIGVTKGLTAPETIQISKQLDQLLYIQQIRSTN